MNEHTDDWEKFASQCAIQIANILNKKAMYICKLNDIKQDDHLNDILSKDKDNDGFIFICSHGNQKELFFWKDKQCEIRQTILDDSNIDLLKNKKLIFIACSALSYLGEMAVKGCSSWCIGYRDKCFFVPEIKESEQLEAFLSGIKKTIEENVSVIKAKEIIRNSFLNLVKSVHYDSEIPLGPRQTLKMYLRLNAHAIDYSLKS